MSPDISVVAEPSLTDVEELVYDNLHKLIPTIGIHPERRDRTADSLCLLFDDGTSAQLIAANINNGGEALLRAAAVMDEVPDNDRVTVLLLSSLPPPGLGWLQRHMPVTWIPTRVLDVEGALGLLLDRPTEVAGTPKAADSSAEAGSARRQPVTQSTATIPLGGPLSAEEITFFRHL